MDKPGFDESYYINKINELQSELDESNELIEGAYNKIKEMELQLALNNSGFSRKTVSVKKIQAYESKIAELEQCVEMLSNDFLDNKENEIKDFLKRLISIKEEVKRLKSKRKVKDLELISIEDTLEGLAGDLSSRYLGLLQVLQVLNQNHSSLDSTNKQYLDNVNMALGVVNEALNYKDNEILRLTKELNRLRAIIIDSSGKSSDIDELREAVSHKDREIEAYKLKIKALEFELNRQN